jgi:hypothetical protein
MEMKRIKIFDSTIYFRVPHHQKSNAPILFYPSTTVKPTSPTSDQLVGQSQSLMIVLEQVRNPAWADLTIPSDVPTRDSIFLSFN